MSIKPALEKILKNTLVEEETSSPTHASRERLVTQCSTHWQVGTSSEEMSKAAMRA